MGLGDLVSCAKTCKKYKPIFLLVFCVRLLETSHYLKSSLKINSCAEAVDFWFTSGPGLGTQTCLSSLVERDVSIRRTFSSLATKYDAFVKRFSLCQNCS